MNVGNMLRNRSRAVTSKQGLMSDQTPTPLLSPTKNPTSSISSFFNSPRFFHGFLAKNASETEAPVMSPTSILDLRNSPSFVNPFGYDRNLSKAPNPSPETHNFSSSEAEAEGLLGLALIDSILEEKGCGHDGNFSGPLNRVTLCGSKLKVQIPETSTLSSVEVSPRSPADFGIKTRWGGVGSPLPVVSGIKDFSRQLSLKEMEMSEDYTCVTTHGPNPKTTHIFDDCVVECCCDEVTEFAKGLKKKVVESGGDEGGSSSSANFLRFCHTCKDVLDQGKDIYIYRGEKAFCSQECRSQEMLSERMENPELDDIF